MAEATWAPGVAYSSNQITCWCRLRPWPPCSLAHPTQFQAERPRCCSHSSRSSNSACSSPGPPRPRTPEKSPSSCSVSQLRPRPVHGSSKLCKRCSVGELLCPGQPFDRARACIQDEQTQCDHRMSLSFRVAQFPSAEPKSELLLCRASSSSLTQVAIILPFGAFGKPQS